jgi:hypothetical protein
MKKFSEENEEATEWEKQEWKKHENKLPSTKEDINKLVSSMPLMASEIEKDNDAYKALQALAAESTQEERAESLKQSGNQAYELACKAQGKDPASAGSKKRFQDAYVYYTQALDLKCSDNTLNSIIHCNRAMVSLKQENYRRVIDDCKCSLNFDPTYVKAYLFASKAASLIEKWRECKIFCQDGVKVAQEQKKDSEVKILTKYLKTALEKIEQIERQEKLEKDAQEAQARQEAALDQAFKDRKLRIAAPIFEYEQYIGKAKVYLASNSELHWPVVFLYPESMQFDIVADFNENQTFSDHLAEMFPPKVPSPAWDTERKYALGNLQVFYQIVETGEKVIVPLRKTLKSLLSHARYEIPGIPTLSVEVRT